MAATAGKKGSVRIGATIVAYCDSWTLNPTKNLADISAYGSSYVSRIGTIKDWSASVTATLDSTDVSQRTWLNSMESTGSSTSIVLRLYSSSVKYWAGNALLDNWSINSKVNDKVSVSFSFKGNGALTYN